MSILESLKARVDQLSQVTKESVRARWAKETEAKRQEKLNQKREYDHRQMILKATGTEDEEKMNALVGELAELSKMKVQTEYDIRQANGNEELVDELNEVLQAIEQEIEDRLSKGDRNYLDLLTKMELAGPDFTSAFHFASIGVERAYVEIIPEGPDPKKADDDPTREIGATLRIERMKNAIATGEKLPPEQFRSIQRLTNPRTKETVCFIQAWVSNGDQTRIAQIKVFWSKLNEIVKAAKKVWGENQKEIGTLNSRVNLTTADLFRKDVEGVVKLTGLTKDEPWGFRQLDGTDGHVWGVVYLSLDHGRAEVIVPSVNWRLRKTCSFLCLLREDGEARKFKFGPNFENIQVLGGSDIPWQRLGQIQAFLCKAAGLKPTD